MAWDYFRFVATNFLGNNKADNCNELVENLMFSYETFMCNVSLNILFLHCHQDIFSENCLALNDKNNECFKHDISEIKRTYQGYWSSPMLKDCCLTIAGDSPGLVHKRQTKGWRS